MTKSSIKQFLGSHWRALLNIVVVLALVALAYGVRDSLLDTISNLQYIHAWFLLLLVPIEFLNYDAQARLYRTIYGVVGEKLSYWFNFKLALELNFISSIFPSGGISGITYFSARMHGNNKSAGQATIIQIMKLVLTYVSFELLLAVGLIILAATGHAGGVVLLFAGALTMAIFSGVLAFMFIITGKSRINGFYKFIVKVRTALAKRFGGIFTKESSTQRFRKWLNDLHNNYKQIESHWRELAPAFWQAFFMNVWEVLAVYIVFLAFGNAVNIGAIILAYAVANLAGLISVLPSGVGIYEALMTGVLLVVGVPASVSIPAVVMYRVVNTIIQLPPGYYLYHRNLRRTNGAAGV